jgi:hypothetical protein
MVLGITDVYKMGAFSVDMAKALGMVKLNLLVGAVHEAKLAIAHNTNTLKGLLVNNDYSVVRSVRYQQKIVLEVLLSFNTQDFAWILQVLRLRIFNFRLNSDSALRLGLGHLLLLFGQDAERFIVIEKVVVVVIRH